METPEWQQVFESYIRGDEVQLTRLLEGKSLLEIFKLGIFCIEKRHIQAAFAASSSREADI